MNKSDFQATVAALTAAAGTTHLSEREKHLIGLAVTATLGCAHCTGGRISKATAAGVPQEAIVAAVDLAATVSAGVTIRTALLGLERSVASGSCADVACVGPEAASPR